MAREQRKDVDYFPHECTHGRKMHIIETKYGNDGYATWFKLLEQLGKANNHYIDISDDMTLMFLTSVFKISEEKTILILTDLAKLGAIDKVLFDENKVIYSQKFSDSIQDAYRNRKGKIIQYSDILNEIRQKNGQSYVRMTPNDTNLTEVIPKEEKSKEEKNKEDIDARKLKFSSTLSPFLEKYGREFLKEFNAYWTEPNKSNTKFKQELEKTWSLERRLETWAKNDKNFNKINQNGKSSDNSQSKPFAGRQTSDTIAKNLQGW